MSRYGNGEHLIVPGDFFGTLKRCGGFYECPRDSEGNWCGPLVEYTGSYAPGKKWVGDTYLNFSMADQWPRVLHFFASELVAKLGRLRLLPDLVLGAPWGGVKFSQEVARMIGCRHIFAEKDGDNVVFGRYEGGVHAGDRVLIGEELVNNMSTTAKLASLIEKEGGVVCGVSCAINRSSSYKTTFWRAPQHDPIPVIEVIRAEISQYTQEDPRVVEVIRRYGVVGTPKHNWNRLVAAMEGR